MRKKCFMIATSSLVSLLTIGMFVWISFAMGSLATNNDTNAQNELIQQIASVVVARTN